MLSTTPTTPSARRTVAHLDCRDRAIVAIRAWRRLRRCQPQVGDWVRFPDGTLERISEPLPGGRAQTSIDARFQLRQNGECYSTSGTHHQPITLARLCRTGERLLADAWIWHHDRRGDQGGVEFRVAFRVFEYPQDRLSACAGGR